MHMAFTTGAPPPLQHQNKNITCTESLQVSKDQDEE